MYSANGYFLIHRSVIHSDIGKDPMLWYVFSHLLARANHGDRTVRWDGEPRPCLRGSFVCSIRGLAESIGICRETLARHIVYLTKRKTISVEKSFEGTMITFFKYEQYQAPWEHENEVVDSIDTPPSHPTGHNTDRLPAPKNELNELNELMKKKKNEAGPISDFNSDESVSSMLETVKHTVQYNWLKLYPTEWVKTELLGAYGWILENPSKKPKSDWARFLGGWLKRGWNQHRKTIQSNPRKKKDISIMELAAQTSKSGEAS